MPSVDGTPGRRGETGLTGLPPGDGCSLDYLAAINSLRRNQFAIRTKRSTGERELPAETVRPRVRADRPVIEQAARRDVELLHAAVLGRAEAADVGRNRLNTV